MEIIVIAPEPGCRNFIGTRNAAKLNALRGINNLRRRGLRNS
jgi:hypothetical protein